MLATKQVLKACMNPSPDRSMVAKSEGWWAAENDETGNKYCDYLSGPLPGFGVLKFQTILLACLFSAPVVYGSFINRRN